VQALVELVVPLAITVLVVQNGQGVAMLRAARHAGEKPDRHAPLVGELRGPAQRSIVRRSGWRRGNWRFA
jgi:hypothetical protein